VKRDLAALAFAMTFPTLMAWIYFVVLAGGEGANPAVPAAYSAGKVVQFLFPVVYVWFTARDRLRPRSPTGSGLLVGLGFGLLVAVAGFGLYKLLHRYTDAFVNTPALVAGMLQKFGMTDMGRYLLFAVAFCVVHSLMEEYYWRWFVFGWLKRWTPVGAAIALSSLAFMGHHVVILSVYFPGRFWTAALPFSLCVAVGGAVWAWLYHRTQSLYAAWASHAVIDAAIFAIGFDMIWPLTA
jgi:membrane protease YdiL (CAAX protease family)